MVVFQATCEVQWPAEFGRRRCAGRQHGRYGEGTGRGRHIYPLRRVSDIVPPEGLILRMNAVIQGHDLLAVWRSGQRFPDRSSRSKHTVLFVCIVCRHGVEGATSAEGADTVTRVLVR